jgi:hypothetical protein
MVEILVLRSWHVRDATKLLSGTAATSAWEASANLRAQGQAFLYRISEREFKGDT